ncbi:MAG: RNA polymerase sigma factor [Thermoguttaceae bacterium]|jgi:RNA polymerase sigma-70 factor (ECF subfamily)
MNARTEGTRGESDEPSSISSTLLDRVKADRPEAWTRLVTLYGPVIYRWCRQAGAARDDAPDLVQEVFAAIARHVGSFRRDRPGDSFGAWLRTITRNTIRGHFRSRRGQAVARGGTDAQAQLHQVPEPLEAVEAGDPREVADLVLPIGLELVRAEFESRTWEAFRRVAIEGQPSARVANDLGMSVEAVYQAKSRVLRRLRRELDGLL